jgi:membrane-associated protein
MELTEVVDWALHMDRFLPGWVDLLGAWLYVLLFAVIFCETGLVVTPILPGDSLLFTAGAVAAVSSLSLPLLLLLLIVAAILGDAVNYTIGYHLGPKVFRYEHSRLLNKKHLLRAHEFYERYGGKTIVLARFIPIIRTFAPFVAGIGKMTYRRFALYNVAGGVTWVAVFLLGGYFLGNVPTVKANFSLVIAAILVISVMPIGIEYLLARRRAAEKPQPVASSTE